MISSHPRRAPHASPHHMLLSRARKEGLMALESDSDAPDKSPVFSKYPTFLKDHHALHFVCDTIRMASGGGVEAFDVDQMMEMDMDTHHHESGIVVAALSTVADALGSLTRPHQPGCKQPGGCVHPTWPAVGKRVG